MWYDILPSVFIISGAMYCVHLVNRTANKFLLDNPYRRQLLVGDHFKHYLRDWHLFGSPYYGGDLNDIPDKDHDPNADKLPECKEKVEEEPEDDGLIHYDPNAPPPEEEEEPAGVCEKRTSA